MSLSLLVPEEKKLPISINFQKSVYPLYITALASATGEYICIYVNTTLYRNSRISRLYCGKTIKDRGLIFGMVPTHILKAKTAKFQVLTPFGSLFFRYPIFKVYTIVYNSADRFSTPLKTFSSRRVFRPFIEQGASPPVLWSRGASPPSSRGCLFPRSRLPAL